jgi:hypothetical protein
MPIPFATDFFLIDGSEIADSRRVAKTLKRAVNRLEIQEQPVADAENSEDTLALYEQATAILKKINVSFYTATQYRLRDSFETLLDIQQNTIRLTQIISSMDPTQLDAGKTSSLKKQFNKFFELIGAAQVIVDTKPSHGALPYFKVMQSIVDEAESIKSAAEQFFSSSFEPLEGSGMCGCQHQMIGGSGYSPMPYKRFL